jgi:TatD DNase family protein
MWETLLPRTRYVGEVGLDAGPKYYGSIEQQKSVFIRVLECCAKAGEKIISVHSVRAARLVLDFLERYLRDSNCVVILHWFTGSASDVRRAISLGCYFSLNHEMLANTRHTKWIAALPNDRILTETDGPFTKVSGRVAIPQDVQFAVELLASLRGMTPGEMKNQIYQNLKTILLEHQ